MRCLIILSLVVMLFAGPVFGSGDALPSGRVVVRVEVLNRTEVDLVARWCEPWAVDLDKSMLITDVNQQQIEILRDFGFAFEIDDALTEKLNRPLQRLKGQTRGIPGYPCYRSVEETHADVAKLAQDHPDLAELIDIGDSWEKLMPGGVAGYDLLVLRITDGKSEVPEADKAKLWIQGGIHARELVSPETVTRFGEYLINHFDSDPNIASLLKYNEVYLLLITNPDGRKMAELGHYWRKNTDNAFHASCEITETGIDLNRNFDFEWGCCGGSSTDPCSNTYRGPSAASEPETQAVQDFLTANFPDWRPDDFTTPSPDDASGIFLDVHSYGGDVFAPTGFAGLPAANDAQMLALAHKFSYFTNYYAQSGGNYTVDGSTTDWGYGRLGLPSYTFELGTEFFQECAPFESKIYPDNLKALLYALKVVRAPFVLPAGPEIVSLMALPSVVTPGGLITLVATADDTRFGPGQRIVPLPIEPVVAAEGCIDVPPWYQASDGFSGAAADGNFDTPVEKINLIVDTSGLPTGTHTAFVRAQDETGQWGPVEAVNFMVLEESFVGAVSGTVRREFGSAPVSAIVSAGPYTVATSINDGSYNLMLPPGMYEITATTPGYFAQTIGEIDITSGSTISRDFVLSRYPGSINDDVEDGNIGWTADPPWQITDTDAASGSHSWADSPGGNYPDGADISLTSPPFNFEDRNNVALSFLHRYHFETGYDYGCLEASIDGGQTWRMLRMFSGPERNWTELKIRLPEFEGVHDVRLRFRIQSDGYLTEDGWFIDDIQFGGDSWFGPPTLVEHSGS